MEEQVRRATVSTTCDVGGDPARVRIRQVVYRLQKTTMTLTLAATSCSYVLTIGDGVITNLLTITRQRTLPSAANECF